MRRLTHAETRAIMHPPRTIYRAQLETRNFDFEAYGETAEKAALTLREGCRKHVTEYRLIQADFDEVYGPEIRVMPIALGQCYRDREPL
jgi:hypothetical protein